MNTKRVVTCVLVVSALSVTLVACADESIAERVENKRVCEQAGGDYEETINGWTYEYSGWNCDLSSNK